jgi:putative heme utilization carrier protein HutX
MNAVPQAAADPLQRVRARLAENPAAMVEHVAREAGVSALAVLRELPRGDVTELPGDRFEAVWTELASWGEILFLIHNQDLVLEVEGSLPVGSFGHGYYNIHGDSPIGGHLRAENCKTICLVDRAAASRRACSVQFFNGAGEAMFKIFVRRDGQRALIADQLARFEALKASYA